MVYIFRFFSSQEEEKTVYKRLCEGTERELKAELNVFSVPSLPARFSQQTPYFFRLHRPIPLTADYAYAFDRVMKKAAVDQ